MRATDTCHRIPTDGSEGRHLSLYELAILGNPSAGERSVLAAELERLVQEFDLHLGSDVVLHDGSTVAGRNRPAAFAATYFGGGSQADLPVALDLIRASLPIIPTVGPNGSFATDLPKELAGSNGLLRRASDRHHTELAVAMLECVGLLRRQRSVFVSYRRTESRAAAVQIHDLLTSRGFDVFLDTHDIRPGEPFQDVLWHRLCDADVMVMLDTPTYFQSKWTREEIGRARAKEIHVLRVVWPAHAPSKLMDLSETVYLDAPDLGGVDGPILDAVAENIVMKVESLRSRSIASRYMSLTGILRAEAEKIGATVEGVGAHRSISLRLLDDRKIWAYPIVGIPTAELLHDVADKAARANQEESPVIVYNNVGIGEHWIAHLKWLDKNISSVRAIAVFEAGWKLSAWES